MKYYYIKCHKTVVAKKVFDFKPHCSWRPGFACLLYFSAHFGNATHSPRLPSHQLPVKTSPELYHTGHWLRNDVSIIPNAIRTPKWTSTSDSDECENNSVLIGPSRDTRLRSFSFLQLESRNLKHISKHVWLSSWNERCMSSVSAVQPSMGDSQTEHCTETKLSLTLWGICTTLHPQLKQFN